ncbi:MAG: SRPBCC family protein [Acidobacteriaceae bacterium]|nr:SRPBCC family protein [Acidobacteriaceae bacterium]
MPPTKRTSSQSVCSLAQSGAPLLLAAGLVGLLGLITKRRMLGLCGGLAAGCLAVRQFIGSQSGNEYEARASFLINCSAEMAYKLWRDFEALPKFMRHLKSVTLLENDGQSQWIAEGPLGRPIRWTAEIIEDVENRRIAWCSVPGSDVDNSGSIEFLPAPSNRGTIATLAMRYTPPAGAAGRMFSVLLGKHPEFTVREDLRRFKAALEAGEIPTTMGQAHGPRGLHGQVHQVLLREQSNSTTPPLYEPERRTA